MRIEHHVTSELIYLACPYSCTDKTKTKEEAEALQLQRYAAVTMIAAKLIAAGRNIYSPITHSYPIAATGIIKGDFATWERLDFAMLERCNEIWILMLPGWDSSVGVKAEMDYMKKIGRPIAFVKNNILDKELFAGDN